MCSVWIFRLQGKGEQCDLKEIDTLPLCRCGSPWHRRNRHRLRPGQQHRHLQKAEAGTQGQAVLPQRDTRAVIGHTRFTTQGSEKRNCNNHPFDGHCGTEAFALAHNGVLYNDKELRREQHLPPTPVETDSYIAVQLLEQGQQLDTENVRRTAELVEGSFVFTILRNDNTLFLVKGNNPLTLYHFPALGLYVYASTKSILDNALKKVKLNGKYSEVDVSEGEIVKMSSSGNLHKSTFTMQDYIHTMFNPYNWNYLNYAKWWEANEREELLLEYCGTFGVSEEEVELLLEVGYDPDEIEELLMDTEAMEEAISEAKALLQCEA